VVFLRFLLIYFDDIIRGFVLGLYVAAQDCDVYVVLFVDVLPPILHASA